MRKYLLFLVIFLASTFLITEKVKAANLESIQVNADIFELIQPLSSYNGNSNIETMKEKVMNALNVNLDTEEYLLVMQEGQPLYGYKWNKNTEFLVKPGITFGRLSSNLYLMPGMKAKTKSIYGVHCSPNLSLTTDGTWETHNNLPNGNRIINGGSVKNGIYQNDGTKRTIYIESTIDLVFNSLGFNDIYYEPITVCDELLCYQYYVDDVFMTKDYEYPWGNRTYTYENLIDTVGINKIEFNFKIPNDKSFDLELLTTFSDIYLSKPYLQIKNSFNEVEISEIDDFLGEREKVEATDSNGVELYKYSGKFGIDFLDITELKLVFDVSNYIDDLYINFTSSFDFEVNVINTIDELDYYKTIMMNDIYGLYLIPKTLNNDNFSNININGIYNIEVRNNYHGTEEYDIMETFHDYSEPNFQYVFKFDQYNYLIYFENTQYNTEEDNTYYITFDTRYYSYSIKENVYDAPIINNPNTGEEIQLPGNDTIEKLPQDMNGFIKYIEKIFNGKTIKQIFNNIYTIFRKTRLGVYLFVIIVSSLVLLWIKSMK